MVQSFSITQVMRLSDLKPLLPIEFNLLGKSQKFNNGIMYPWSNPADYASRGLYVTNLEKIHGWFSGPSILWSKDRLAKQWEY